MSTEIPVREINYKHVMTDEMIEAAVRVLRGGKYIRSHPRLETAATGPRPRDTL